MSNRLGSVRVLTAALGVASGSVSAWHAKGALEVGAPTAAVAFLSCVAVLKATVSLFFAAAPGRKRDGAFLFVFGIASLEDMANFFAVPLLHLLFSPAAFLAGSAAVWRDARKRRGSR